MVRRVPPISTEEEAAAIVAALEALPLAHAREAREAGAGAGTRRRVLPLFAFLEALDIPKGTKGSKGARKTPGRIIWSHLEASSAKKSTSPLSTSSTPLPKLPKSLPCEISGQRADTQGLLLRDVPALLEAYLPLETRYQYLIENSAVSNAIAAALSRAAGEEDGGGAAAAMEEARGRTRKEWAAKLEREQALQLPELLEGMGPLAIRTSTTTLASLTGELSENGVDTTVTLGAVVSTFSSGSVWTQTDDTTTGTIDYTKHFESKSRRTTTS